MTRRLSILSKGFLLIAIPLFFQLAFIGLVARMRRENAGVVDLTIHTKDVIAVEESCRAGLLSAHGAIQGYIITHDPPYAARLARLDRSARERLAALRGLVVDNEDQSRAAVRIEAKAHDFLAFMAEGAEFVRAGRMDPDTATRRRTTGQDWLDGLDREFDVFGVEEQRLDAIRRGLLDESRGLLTTLLVGGVVVSVLSTVAVAVLFARNISGRVVNLTENSHRLAAGRELRPPIGGGDEVARLDRVFHDMARTLAEAARRERTHAEVLGRRAEELAAVNDQLNEKARENEMFVYSVSHDLRSPLVNLQGFSKELGLIGGDLARLVDAEGVPPEVRRRARGLIDSEMAESVGFIQVAVTRLGGIIDALLRLSRAGRVEYRRQVVDVDAVVGRVVAALRGTIEGRGAVVAVGDLPPTTGDPTAIEQVFANLIGNAVNYLDPARPGRIDVFAVGPTGPSGSPAPPGTVVYAVRDNGLGIADLYKAKIFTAFQRLHGDIAKGEGVGLALVRRVVERHGGRIWFDSKAGRGTTFWVALPAAGPGPADGEPGGPVEMTADSSNPRDAAWQPSR